MNTQQSMMTNATTVQNNSTNHDQINEEICNQTLKSDKGTHNCSLNSVQIEMKHCSNNTDCNATIAIENKQENHTNINQVIDKDTVLKYVYKSGDKDEISLKNKGHFKNSLKRRKRSANEAQNNSPLPSKFQKPALIVNYETSHGPRQSEPLLSVRNTGNTILGANLADFKIETVHANPNINRDEHSAGNQNKDSTEIGGPDESSDERNDYQQSNNKKSSQESEEDDKKGSDYRDDENSAELDNYHNQESRDSDENSFERKKYKDALQAINVKDDSNEHKEYQNTKSGQNIDDRSDEEDYDKRSPTHKDSSRQPEEYRYKKTSKESDESAEPVDYKNRKSSDEEDDSRERRVHKNKEDIRERDDSSEREVFDNNRNDSTDSSNSAESEENNHRVNSRYTSPKSNSKESSESNENVKYDSNSAENKDSKEPDNSDSKTHDASAVRKQKSKYIQDDKSDKSLLHQDYLEHNNKEIDSKKNYESSREHSDEHIENKENKERHQNNKAIRLKYNNKTVPSLTQDIDLNDFSYERIQANDKSNDESRNDNHEEVDPNTAVEILPLSTATPELNTKILEHPITNEDSITKSEKDSKLIHINDGEVRPVVEINSENDDSSEENSKSSLNDESESLESLLGIKEPEIFEDSDKKNKIIAQKEDQNGDVKQQFERIPLNYNHNENSYKDSETTKAPKVEDSGEIKSDGTLDVFAPEDIKYDENLNIKFDDLTIKLPEIKLPEDILAYTRDNSQFNEENKKQSQPDVSSYKPSYYYSHDDREEPPKRNHKNDDDNADDEEDDEPNTDYYGHYNNNDKKENYKKKTEEAESDEDEDLYEKFVRERFGKKGTFEKRSEKLEAAPRDPELYKTIKNILKKTADIDEQAKKSGDPNAGYMWTLEYGEKL